MNDELHEALGNYEVALGSPLGTEAVNTERRAYLSRVQAALAAAREEGRRAGLLEARLIAFEATNAPESECVSARRVYDRLYALVWAGPRGKVDECRLCPRPKHEGSCCGEPKEET